MFGEQGRDADLSMPGSAPRPSSAERAARKGKGKERMVEPSPSPSPL